MTNERQIQIRGLRVHNLRGIDIDLPLGKLIVVSGVSGSGKSSLAFDTLFAEGQRRYIETFSAYTRQFLERIDRPDADSIANIPPAIAIRQRTSARNSRSTVGSITEINDYLRLLFAKIGRVFCQGCGQPIRSDTAQGVAATLGGLEEATEYFITFPLELSSRSRLDRIAAMLRADGFVRVAVRRKIVNLDSEPLPAPPAGQPLRVVVDRLAAGRVAPVRLLDSIETAFARGNGRCDVILDPPSSTLLRFSRRWRCDPCDRDYPPPEPRLFNSNNPLGACPECRGFGDIIDIDMDRVVPDKSKSIRQGAIVPWNTPNYEHELEELLALADDYGIPVDVPFSELSQKHLKLIHRGVPEREFGGLRGFFNWLERKKYKMHIRVFLSRWRSYRTCPACEGRRLRDVALATQVGGKNIAEILALEVREAVRFFHSLPLPEHERAIGQTMLDQIARRLGYLESVGVGYLTLNRPTRTLSGGEAQRVALTKALGAGLVNTLYVLDEPSIGLHERDTHRLIETVRALRDSRNSVVVVEHDESFLRAADHLVDLGPGAGEAGGQIVYQGPLGGLKSATNSATADFLGHRRSISVPAGRRAPEHGWIRVRGARGNNLKNLDVDFPLGVLCVVTGVSGSGKSTLVEQTLYAGLCRQLGKPGPRPVAYDAITCVPPTEDADPSPPAPLPQGERGAVRAREARKGGERKAGPPREQPIRDAIGDCILVDQSPIGRTSRSNPVTYVKAFGEIRRAFADTSDARIRNYGPGHFSFNVEGGRCTACEGQGVQIIDMQFLADISITCPECGGLRYRREVLDVKFRGKTIGEVLDMSVCEAMSFFRGRINILESLAPLMSVGLDYLKLGQPANTLSGGEAQRLKLAGQLAATTRQSTLLILDEPTTGLHAADILRLLDCFTALLNVGHSLVVVEHNLDVIKSADWIIDLGPEAAADGGRLVACGTPEQIAQTNGSHTGHYLRRALSSSNAR